MDTEDYNIILLLLAVFPTTSPHLLGYSLDEQLNWHKIRDDYDKCAFGKYQTPIHIEHHHIEPILMPAIDFIGYHNFLHPPLTISNNGHTVKVELGDYWENSVYNAPQITGALLSSVYVLKSLHFHWGKDNDEGSEHVINHVRYPMEMHLVHINKNYNTTDEALKHKDGVAVLGFFFHLRVGDNRKFNAIFMKLKHLTEISSASVLDRSFAVSTILPSRLEEFFTYEGSLTTPPCSEAVTWFLFPDTIPISFKQMELFRSLSITNNFRVLQEVGQRKVYLRRNDRFVEPDFDRYDRHNITARSFWLY